MTSLLEEKAKLERRINQISETLDMLYAKRMCFQSDEKILKVNRELVSLYLEKKARLEKKLSELYYG